MLNRLTADVREMFQEQVTYRELLMQMTRRDLMLRYKQTVMGFGWAVFMPVLNTIIFSLIFAPLIPTPALLILRLIIVAFDMSMKS